MKKVAPANDSGAYEVVQTQFPLNGATGFIKAGPAEVKITSAMLTHSLGANSPLRMYNLTWTQVFSGDVDFSAGASPIGVT